MKLRLECVYDAGVEIDTKVICPHCGDEIRPAWEPLYNGYRATCIRCDASWPES